MLKPIFRNSSNVNVLRIRKSLHTKYSIISVPTIIQTKEVKDYERDINECKLCDKENKLESCLPANAKGFGLIPAYNRHVLLISPIGVSGFQWCSNLKMDGLSWPFNVIKQLQDSFRFENEGNDILINAISLQNHTWGELKLSKNENICHVLVLPDYKIYKIKKDKVEVDKFIQFLKCKPNDNMPVLWKNYEECLKDWIFICGHQQRDERCGIIGHELVPLFEKYYGDKKNIAIISHIGGHKYAGNVIYYNQIKNDDKNKELADCLWFGKVLPPNLKTLCDSLENKKIIKELYRGGVSMQK
ncbi:Aim32p NDAI_0D01390 [Naumovozyma dairenensis CBS 421]|uniref:Altered inheritance of mitochondria protein 32 n=1 Tax=Naumovozyma dairenensis (strain ATCC 10597 / BCRC 20456 / CBS 421 / NBRC 0211 / NRRL Y-12639) TaxID=1071378 RepID=G0W9J2_NAUDC|nr:hypothetical protein NDAI_0D01390 [Naumovozyma dairenensis CBS 421]CCD24453.1 hypothetical protein NDAI_0D01390 [Naumovozyma dairenensis CBS 421]